MAVSLGLILGSGISSWASIKEDVSFPSPLGYVSDYAEILEDKWYQQIRTICQDLEQQTGVEMLVVTMKDIKSFPHAREYASRLYEAWRIGSAQQERGILLFASVKERQAVVVVGKTLITAIPPRQIDDMSVTIFQPMFTTREYGVNLYRAAVSLAALAGEAPRQQEQKKSRRQLAFWMNVGVVVLMFYALWRFTRPERRHPFPRWKRGEYWGIGQGGFGGNWGGFGGSTGGTRLRE
ncbi:MAG: YgcG family protein [Nitrospirales bacterium]